MVKTGPHPPDGRGAGDARPGVRRLRRADPARPRSAIEDALPHVAQIPLGGTATGTGLNTHPEFAERVRELLAQDTGLEIRAARGPLRGAGQPRRAGRAVGRAEGASPCRSPRSPTTSPGWAPGPRAGLAELFLPELQKGSSIMPGKVNPVIREVVLQVGAQVIGNDTADHGRRHAGQLRAERARAADRPQPARPDPAADERAARLFAEKCVEGIEVNREMTQAPRRGEPDHRHRAQPRTSATTSAREIVKEAAASGRHAARGRAREGRRRGDARRGARPARRWRRGTWASQRQGASTPCAHEQRVAGGRVAVGVGTAVIQRDLIELPDRAGASHDQTGNQAR